MMRHLKIFLFTLILVSLATAGFSGDRSKDARFRCGGGTVPEKLHWYMTGPGGGGWCWGGAFHPDDPDVFIVGADVTGIYRTTDGGVNLIPYNNGITNHDNTPSHYISQCVGISNENFSGFVATSFGGVYFLEDGSSEWDWKTTIDDDWAYERQNGTRWTSIPFSVVDTDDSNFMLLGAGQSRAAFAAYNHSSAYDWEAYPNVVYETTKSVYSLWRWDFTTDQTEPLPDWPSTASGLGNVGCIRDISINYAANGDTLVAVTVANRGDTSDGIYWYDGADWRDLSARDFHYAITFNGGAHAVTGAETVWDNRTAAAGIAGYTVHVTARKTIYLSIIQMDNDTDQIPSGLYRLHDASDVTDDWWYVGDHEDIFWYSSDALDQWASGGRDAEGSGMYGHDHQFPWSLVFEGSKTDPDTVWTFAMNKWFASSSALCTYTDAWHEDQEWSDEAFVEYNSTQNRTDYHRIDPGWHVDWGMGVVFQPFALNSNNFYMHTAIRHHVTNDGGATFHSVSDIENGSSDEWHTTGMSEQITGDLAIWSNNRVIAANGDVGMFVSVDSDQYWWEWEHPYFDYDEPINDDACWSQYAVAVEVIDNFNSTGRPAAIVLWSEYYAKSRAGRVMIWHDENNDGTETWEPVSIGLVPNEGHYLYMAQDLVVLDGTDVYVQYEEYSDYIGGTHTFVETGVMLFEWTGAAWTATEFNTGLTPATEVRWTQIMHVTSTNRLFMSAGHDFDSGEDGGIVYCDLDDGTPTWKVCAGFDGTGSAVDEDDVWCLETNSDGSVLYAGQTGNYYTTWPVLSCTNGSAVDPVWTGMIATTTGDMFMEIPIPANNDGYGMTTELLANQKLPQVRQIYVDPTDDDILYIGIKGWNSKVDWSGGLWEVDVGATPDTWENLTRGTMFRGTSAFAIIIVPTTPRLLMTGAMGQGIGITALDFSLLDAFENP